MKRPLRLLVVAPAHIYGLRVISGVHAYCRDKGNWEFHFEHSSHPGIKDRIRFAIREWKTDAIIALVDTSSTDRLLFRAGVPAVNFSGYFESRLPTVIADNAACGRMAAQHLMNNGLRNFAFCANTTEMSPRQRCAGFVKELARNGYDCKILTDRYSGAFEKNWVRNRKQLDRFLRSLGQPAGIMCAHDTRALEVAWACRRAGFRVPDDIALVSVGDDEVLCRTSTPPLSSINTDGQRIGYEAARLVHRMIRGHRPPSRPVLVPPRGLTMRQSSDVIGVDDGDVAAAMRFIRDRAHKPISVKDLLEEVAISRRSLEQRFAKLIGRTPKQEIMRVRINHVRDMLARSDLSAGAIAMRCGFSRPDKLSRAFRRETGETPIEYRLKHTVGD